jgi:hypothetical protein
MKIFNRLLWLIIFAFLFQNGVGQIVVLPLDNNAVVKSHAKLFPAKKAASDVLLDLPFLDDFSNNSPLPDPANWEDRDAFINKTYAVNPVSTGVATLDAINEFGAIYANATIYPNSFVADHLTSHPVNLDYPAADSIYISFFYQSTGLGLMPLEPDSLCLDFYNPTLDTWSNIWQIPGDTMEPFKQVMIPIADTAFLKNGFQFRFRNRASMPKNTDYIDKRGNVDHWHIDYVRLDRLRSKSDIVIRDVAFSKPLFSMLKDYESLPWDHLQKAHSTQYLNEVEINYFNNDTAIRNVTRYLEIKNLENDDVYSSGAPITQDIFPGTSLSNQISSIYPFEFGIGDTAQFEIKSYLRTDDFDNKVNDTITKIQEFKDYFAYDDGTAERAAGLRGQGTSSGVMAVRFNSYISDQLGGVYIYFTQLMDSLNMDYYFKIKVWDDNNGEPGNILYNEDLDYKVMYRKELNKFSTIKFKNPVPVDGTFYVGIQQFNIFMLNVGLDINNPANNNVIYTIGNNWSVSDVPGSLMIRPFVKRYYSPIEESAPEKGSVLLYPNPVSEYLNVKFPDMQLEEKVNINMYNITGQLVASESNSKENIYVGHLPEGIYIVTFQSEHGSYPSERIIISK